MKIGPCLFLTFLALSGLPTIIITWVGASEVRGKGKGMQRPVLGLSRGVYCEER